MPAQSSRVEVEDVAKEEGGTEPEEKTDVKTESSEEPVVSAENSVKEGEDVEEEEEVSKDKGDVAAKVVDTEEVGAESSTTASAQETQKVKTDDEYRKEFENYLERKEHLTIGQIEFIEDRLREGLKMNEKEFYNEEEFMKDWKELQEAYFAADKKTHKLYPKGRRIQDVGEELGYLPPRPIRSQEKKKYRKEMEEDEDQVRGEREREREREKKEGRKLEINLLFFYAIPFPSPPPLSSSFLLCRWILKKALRKICNLRTEIWFPT